MIRDIVDSLHKLYGAELVYGIRGGYMGFTSEEDTPYVLLSSDKEAQHFQTMYVTMPSPFLRKARFSNLYIVSYQPPTPTPFFLSVSNMYLHIHVARVTSQK